MNLLFISLGCDKNRVDSELMLSELLSHGLTLTDEEEEADVILINTCCFIGDAKEESIEMILRMVQYKRRGSCRAVIVSGCLAQRYQKQIREEIPEVDAVIGTGSLDRVWEAVHHALLGETSEYFDPPCAFPRLSRQLLTTPGQYAYLKIAEGCDKCCTYCIIPSLRGHYRSVPIPDLVKQARYLVQQGVSELILVAQETTRYGIDLYGEKSLHKLLDALNEIPGLLWIRLLYCYPEEIDDELLDSMLRNEKVCRYLDIPVQHCNDEILRRMGRHTTKEELTARIAHIRQKIPDVVLRTTLICGFPGESKAMHEELLQFVRESAFDRLGAFAYSREEDTPAASFPHQISEKRKKAWVSDVMALQEKVSEEQNKKLIGKDYYVLLEGKLFDEDVYIGRTYRDAPDVDGYIFIRSGRDLMTGDICRAHVTGSLHYDLIGEILE